VTAADAVAPAAPGAIPPGAFEPAPGAAPLPRMIAAQTAMETRTLLRNGEQLTVTLVIPLGLLAMFSLEPLVNIGGGSRVDFLAPGIIALAVMSTAFTSQAIATGFERRYGVLKRLGATPLSRAGLISAKTATVIIVELLQAAIITAAATGLGWRPHASALAFLTVPLLVLVGTAAFSGLALLMAGTLRAEATLALANLVYIVLLGVGGVVFPLTKFPAAVRPLLTLLPTGALATGLRAVLADAAGVPVRDLIVLAVWAVVTIGLAMRTFRWE
jgi:ABC-2 type transport system permease protein